ncbi:hypothetical protein NBRC111894_3526 [Sporolactobacillus inulinus]|uniref:Uncharacterized protein n=1 Tax=Sporolactobacillus inulinus TaxID=2078 RepID=A0A4Y1ZFM1_9BACL|nr:hypothetical protein [Sporolactobacillus inulinus]GAY77972.1 hypothetical protein NBRC111894_3526 [Sporolactobacillus inulinus]
MATETRDHDFTISVDAIRKLASMTPRHFPQTGVKSLNDMSPEERDHHLARIRKVWSEG